MHGRSPDPDEPARVLCLVQPTVGGAATCVAQLARAGTEAGLEVTVACPPEGELPEQVRAAGARWQPVALRRQPTPTDLARVVEVRRLVRGADLVHLHSSKAGAVGRLAMLGNRARPPCVYTPHGWPWLVGGPMAWAYRRFERITARLADVIVAVSPEDAAAGATVLGREASRIRIIENGVDVDRYEPEGLVAERGPEPLVVCVGRLTEAKGQLDAIGALALLSTEDARLRLVGTGPDRALLVRHAEELGVAHRVEWVGEVDDAAPHYRAADVVVVPSRWDAQSLVLLEAMASGAAIVATTVSGSAALEGAGALVPPRDEVALAAAVDGLLADPDRRRVLGAAARRRAVDGYTLARSTKRTIGLWRELVRDHLERRR